MLEAKLFSVQRAERSFGTGKRYSHADVNI